MNANSPNLDPMMVSLSPTQKSTVVFIGSTIQRTGTAPTLQEIADHFLIAKVSAYERVQGLLRKGVLVKTEGYHRFLRLADTPAMELARLVMERFSHDIEAVKLARQLLAA